MFNSFLAQEAASTSCADGGEYERLDLMKDHKGMEPWIGIMRLFAFEGVVGGAYRILRRGWGCVVARVGVEVPR